MFKYTTNMIEYLLFLSSCKILKCFENKQINNTFQLQHNLMYFVDRRICRLFCLIFLFKMFNLSSNFYLFANNSMLSKTICFNTVFSQDAFKQFSVDICINICFSSLNLTNIVFHVNQTDLFILTEATLEISPMSVN